MVWTDRNEANLLHASLAGTRYERSAITMMPNMTATLLLLLLLPSVGVWMSESE